MSDENQVIDESAVGNADGGGADNWQVPDGFDAGDFDENHALIPEKVKERHDKVIAERDNYKKQSEDMRKKMSVKDGLGTPEEYGKGFTADEKFVPALSGENGEFITATLANLDKIAHERKFSLDDTNAIKAPLLSMLEEIGIITTDDNKAKHLAAQKEILGDNADEIIKRNVEFMTDFDVASDAEKKMLTTAMQIGTPYIVSFIDKVRVLLGQGKSSDIPASTNSDGLPPDETLLSEYNDPKTTDERKMEIIKKRAEAGRPTKFAHL
jgi:hypothetical protein